MTKAPKLTYPHASNRLLLTMAISYIGILVLLSSWWAYLMFDLAANLGAEQHRKVVRIIMWEGSAFLLVLLALFISFIVLYLREQQKTKSLQAFFAGLTHELKTPLASIRLQGEVLGELVSDQSDQKLQTITKRMAQDVAKLETQMDKILQLSRIERGGPLNPVTVNIKSFFDSVAAKSQSELNFHWEQAGQCQEVMADEFALELIIKNLIENTKGHTDSNQVRVSLSTQGDKVIFSYSDGGVFEGEARKLGELFYKHNSSRGSGIGLYLISKLMNRMGGRAEFIVERSLTTKLIFLQGGTHE